MARKVDPELRRQRRETVVTAAARLFAERGYANTSTAQIAKAAGISTGSLFYHFDDKPAIFRAVFARDIDQSRELFDERRDASDPVAAILEVVTAMVAAAREEGAGEIMVELLRQVGHDQQLLASMEETERIQQAGLVALLRRAAAQQRIDPRLDLDETATWIRVLVDAVYLNSEKAAAQDPAPMLRLIVTRMLRAEPTSNGRDHEHRS